jgi:phosphoglycolate phosphatase
MDEKINFEFATVTGVKCIIFDFDGTLASSKRVFVNIFNEIAEKHKFRKMTRQNIVLIRKMSMVERFRYLGIPMYKLPFLSAIFLNLYHQAAEQVTMVDGMRDVIYNLHRNGYALAIISSNSRKNVDHFLHRNQIDCINHISCSGSIYGKDKMIRKFLRTAKLNSNEVIYVGDEQRDIEASKKNNLKILWVNWGYDDIDAVIDFEPDHIICKPADILKVFDIQVSE